MIEGNNRDIMFTHYKPRLPQLQPYYQPAPPLPTLEQVVFSKDMKSVASAEEVEQQKILRGFHISSIKPPSWFAENHSNTHLAIDFHRILTEEGRKEAEINKKKSPP